MTGRLAGLAGGLGLAAAAVLVSVALLEITIRIVAPQNLHRDEGLFSADGVRAFKLTPGFRGVEVSHEFTVPIAINGQGLRDREIAPAKPPGVFRILVLGDSFTYGSGVAAEETYPKRLEAFLRARGDAAEVINAGVSGYGTVHEALFLRDEGWRYEPDALVLQVFPNNDLTDNLHPFTREVRGGFLRFVTDRGGWPPLERVKEVVRARSHAYRFLGDRWNLLRIRLGWEPFYAASLGVYRAAPPAEIARGWEATARALGGIARAARERRVPVVVVHAPKSVALDAALQAAFIGFHRADARALDWELPARRLAELCRAERVAFLDLAPRFRRTGRPLDLYYPHNGHWNARGHELVAAALLERLDDDGVVRRRPDQAAPAPR